MTREETVQVLSLLKAAYPNSYKGMSRQEGNGVIMVWATQFSDVPVQVVLMAINKLIATKTFPPAISEVKEKLKGMYYEAISELTMYNSYISGSERKALEMIRDYCRCESEEPSLKCLVSNSNELMLT